MARSDLPLLLVLTTGCGRPAATASPPDLALYRPPGATSDHFHTAWPTRLPCTHPRVESGVEPDWTIGKTALLQARWPSSGGEHRLTLVSHTVVAIDPTLPADRPQTLWIAPRAAGLDLTLTCDELTLVWQCGDSCHVELRRPAGLPLGLAHREPRWFTEGNEGVLLFDPEEISLVSDGEKRRLVRLFRSWMGPVARRVCATGCNPVLAELAAMPAPRRITVGRLEHSEGTIDREKEQAGSHRRSFDAIVDGRRWKGSCVHRCCGWGSNCDFDTTRDDGTSIEASMDGPRLRIQFDLANGQGGVVELDGDAGTLTIDEGAFE